MQSLLFILFSVLILHSPFLNFNSAQAAPAAVPKTGQTTSYAARDDGDLERGVSWPEQRFSDNGNGTVTDNLTGLVWLRDANCTDSSGGVSRPDGYLVWQDALTWSNNLSAGRCGLSDGSHAGDWRLPNVDELESLVDLEHYNPALPTGYPFSNVQTTSYWSSSTYAFNSYNAWVVYMECGAVLGEYKEGYNYVWPVRSRQTVALGTFTSIEITNDTGEAIGTQSVNTPFNIKITAKDGSGNVVTSVNGYLSLGASIGGITPMSPLMQSGVAVVNNVRLFSPGNMTIQATLNGVYGSSLPFVVLGATNTASVTGKVVNGVGNAWVGATVHLEMDAASQTATTDSAGKYSFTGLAPGKYTLWAQETTLGNRSIDYTDVKLGDGTPAVRNIEISNAICNPSTRTPVLLVPGIMGSSVGWGGPYPILPNDPPNWREFPKKTKSWGLHDPNGIPGWRDLVGKLEQSGYQKDCTIFPVPYDWRMDINSAAKEYLKNWIDEAKRKAGTSKVNVIAHSMGGLVTRAYIQSDYFNNDIDRFAMVGTPNHGSSLTYYMVEGGDPAMADTVSFLKDPSFSYLAHFYQMTSEMMYRTYHSLPLMPAGSLPYRLQIYNLYDDHIKSASQLLPTYGFLNFDRELDCIKNEFLPGLNSSDTIDRMGNATGKVITKLFAGNGSDTTLKNIASGPKNCSSPLYKDGLPLSSLLTSDANGDGTVLLTSASLSLELEQHDKAETHAALVKTYADDIVSFIGSSAVPYIVSEAESAKIVSLPSADALSATNEVSVMLYGHARILVTDSLGRRSGIEPITGVFLDEVAECDVVMDEDKAVVSFLNAADGIYTITISSNFSEDYRIYVSYHDAGAAVQKEYYGFNHANTTSLNITINSDGVEKVSVNHTPLQPTGLQADAFDSAGLKTRLTWSASTDTSVTGYMVYAKSIDEPYLVQIGTSTTAAFDTNNPWAENSSITTRIYAVSAIKADGTESFLSDMAQNNDRDHDGLTDAEELAAGTDPTKIDTDGDGYSDFEEQQNDSNPLVPASVPTVTLLITKTGAGIGDVSVTNGTVCGTSCEPVFNLNTLVTLTAIPDRLSTFGGWTSCDSIGTNGECNVTMSAFKGVSASFNLAPKAMIGAAGYSLLSDAYTAAGATAEILTLDDVLIGNVTLDQDKAITLRGGWNAAYSARSGYTTLKGTLTIRNGSLQVDGVKVW